MKTTYKLLSAMLVGACVLLAGGAALGAEARGVFIGRDKLAAEARALFEKGVAAARQADAQPFERLAALRARLAELDLRKRGRMAAVTPMLKALGTAGLWPMLEEMALSAEPRGALPASAWLAWRLGLLEAVGSLRDARATAVLEAIAMAPDAFGGPADGGVEGEHLLVREAVAAYGKLATDEVAKKLVALGKATTGARRLAVLAGTGHCRRQIVAEWLAKAAAGAADTREAALVAHALGDVGSAWAWQTPAVEKSGEERGVRRVAAEALVAAFVAHAGARAEITKAVLVVDHPDTLSIIATARGGASAETRAALDELAATYQKSPLH
jgi:hypothetical protein